MDDQKLREIKLKEITENEWSRPINSNFAGKVCKSQISLTNLKDTSENTLVTKNYEGIRLVDILWKIEQENLKLATHPLFVQISENRNSNAKAYRSIMSKGEFLMGSGIQYNVENNSAILGTEISSVDPKSYSVSFGRTADVTKLENSGECYFDSYTSWPSNDKKNQRRMSYPIRLGESHRSGTKMITFEICNLGYTFMYSNHNLDDENYSYGIRLMRVLEQWDNPVEIPELSQKSGHLRNLIRRLTSI